MMTRARHHIRAERMKYVKQQIWGRDFMIEKANYSSVQHRKESVRTFMLITEQKYIQIQPIFILKGKSN